MSDSCEFGRIAEITDTQYRIVLDENSSCKSCGMKELCAQKEVLIDREEVDSEFRLNEPVEMVFEKVVQTSFLLYIVPLLFFFAGIIIPQSIFNIRQEPLLIVTAFAAMAASFLFIRRIYEKLDKDRYKIIIKHKKYMDSPSLSTGGSHAD